LESIDFQGLLHCFSGIITLYTWNLFRDYYVAIQGLLLYLYSFQGLLLYLDSFQGLLRYFSGIITVPGFFSGIVTTPLICLGIITVLIFDLITVLIFDLITVLDFRDYSGDPLISTLLFLFNVCLSHVPGDRR
jgi:hypothetical protein